MILNNTQIILNNTQIILKNTEAFRSYTLVLLQITTNYSGPFIPKIP